MWQNLVIAVAQVSLAAVLWPTLRNKAAAIPRSSSIPTAASLLAISVCFLTMPGYELSAVTSLTSAAAWTYIAIFRPLKVRKC